MWQPASVVKSFAPDRLESIGCVPLNPVRCHRHPSGNCNALSYHRSQSEGVIIDGNHTDTLVRSCYLTFLALTQTSGDLWSLRTLPIGGLSINLPDVSFLVR